MMTTNNGGRHVVRRLLASLILAATVSICPAQSKLNPSADQAMGALARECLTPFKSRGVSKVAMTYIFHNGSTETAVSNFVKRQLTTHLLREAGRDVALIDRQDFQLQHKEDGFAFIFSTGTGNLSQPVPVDAILVGELITSPACRTMVVCLKAIDPKTSRILSASVASIGLTKDFAAKLGISELDLDGLPTLPQPLGDIKRWASDLSAAFDPQQTTCSLDDPGNAGAAMAMNSRLLRAYLTSALVSAKWSLLEREMFFLVAKDQAAAGVKSSYPVGEVILRLETDDTGVQDSPSCFAKAIQIKDGRLLGQSQVSLSGSVAGPNAGGDIGGDQALAEALRRTQGKLSPSKEDSLVFSSSVILTNVFKPSDKLKGFAFEVTPDLFDLSNDEITHSRMNMMWSPGKVDWENGFAAKKHNELTLIRLNAIEKGDLNAIKADMVCALLWGYGYSGFMHLGPLLDVVRQVSSQYSLKRDGSDSTEAWLSYFKPENRFAGWAMEGFSGRLLQSLHPKYRTAFENDDARSRLIKPLPYPAGTYSNSRQQSGERPSIHFNYRIETVWKDAFPSTIKVTIDLSPMKNNLYKRTQ